MSNRPLSSAWRAVGNLRWSGLTFAFAALVGLLVAGCGGGGGVGTEDAAMDLGDLPDGGGRVPDGGPDTERPSDADAAQADVGFCDDDEECVGLAHGACEAPRCNLLINACVLEDLPNGTPCEGDNPCYVASCSAGACIGNPAEPVDCNDDNPCTNDSCDPAVGCRNEPTLGSCDDLRACTTNDSCQPDGTCAGERVACDDNEACTADRCVEPTGCVFENLSNPCNDRSRCTVDDACGDGTCVPGATLPCDDHNPCTDDFCDGERGCVYTPNAAACDDGNPCTQGDACVIGRCAPGPSYTCPPCTSIGDCAAYEDGNPCNGTLVCATGRCLTAIGTIVTCEAPADTQCGWSACDPATGQCALTLSPNGTVCWDGDVCTVGDHCQDGVCVAEPAACDDRNVCTDDACDPTTGCRFTPHDSLACDDGDPCTGLDQCLGGACQPGPVPLCLPCVADGDCAAIDDGDRCNGVLSCIDGTCALDEGSVVVCDTSNDNPCRQTRCDPATGTCSTQELADGEPCSSGDPCRYSETCLAGACFGTALDCGDGNPCTDDLCLGDQTCEHVNNQAPCEDGDLCTAGDRCASGVCQTGVPNTCDDNNACTRDGCNPSTGCYHDPVAGACNDGDPCTQDDRCVAGECTGDPLPCDDLDPCTDDACDPAAGECVHTPNMAPCDDGDLCTLGDACQTGVCVPGIAPDCSDGNVCTSDACEPAVGCIHQPIAGVCDDGDACTVGDRCDEGVCSGSGPDCEDGDPCTATTCDAQGQCTFDPVACCGDGRTGAVQVLEGFESADFPLPGSGYTVAGFQRDSSLAFSGEYAMASHTAAGGTTSRLTLALAPGARQVCFRVRGSSQFEHDVFRFLVDDEEQLALSGSAHQYAWLEHCAPLTATNGHTLTWQYEKDDAGSAHQDRFWVDAVALQVDEVCDDRNRASGDGCSADCRSDERCGNALVDLAAGETCDDGNTVPSDGCDGSCQVENGFACPTPGAPCTTTCGDSITAGTEQCDDGQNGTPCDGCDDDCQTFVNACGDGHVCDAEQCDDGQNGTPCDGCADDCTVFVGVCGDGDPCGLEMCDDGNTVGLDGCSADCQSDERCGNGFRDDLPLSEAFDYAGEWGPLGWITNGFVMTCNGGDCTVGTPHGYPSSADLSLSVSLGADYHRICYRLTGFQTESCCDVLTFLVDDVPQADHRGGLESFEHCVDVDPAVGHTYTWRFTSDGSISYYGFDIAQVLWFGSAAETCDDGNGLPGDGCDEACQIEPGWLCPAAGELCEVDCGDGFVLAPETCDDGNTTPGDGCDAECQRELGWQCPAEGGACATFCGDGIPAGAEPCDDGQNGDPCDGCLDTCERHYNVCGDGFLCELESCDDGNLWPGDGCAPDCQSDETCGNGWLDTWQIVETFDHNGTLGGLGWTSSGFVVTCDGADCRLGTPHNYPDCIDFPLEIVIPAGYRRVCYDIVGFDTDGCCDYLSFQIDGSERTNHRGQLGDFTSCHDMEPTVQHTYRWLFHSDCGSNRHGFDFTNIRWEPTKGETCDDSNLDSADGCDFECHIEDGWICDTPGESCYIPCGDGIVFGYETCDDANLESGDGCDSTCHGETGWDCPLDGGACTAICGDELVVGAEGCDDGQNGDLCDGCLDDCTAHINACGDGFGCPGEICDDGNPWPGDGCSTDCLSDESCGNGILDDMSLVEDFSHGGDFGPLPWVNNGFVLHCNAQGCRVGTPHNYAQNSNLSLQVEVGRGYNEVCFALASFLTEGCCDRLYFDIDGTEQQSWSGNVGSRVVCFGVDPDIGHTYRWRFISDYSGVYYGFDITNVTWHSFKAEDCDDGNNFSEDGCDAVCTIEPGFICPEPGEPCVPE